MLDVEVRRLDDMLESFRTDTTLHSNNWSAHAIDRLLELQEWEQATYMSELELCLLQQGTADEAPVLPVLGLCFEEGELVLLATTIASKS